MSYAMHHPRSNCLPHRPRLGTCLAACTLPSTSDSYTSDHVAPKDEDSVSEIELALAGCRDSKWGNL